MAINAIYLCHPLFPLYRRRKKRNYLFCMRARSVLFAAGCFLFVVGNYYLADSQYLRLLANNKYSLLCDGGG